jgi:homoserine kinase type II
MSVYTRIETHELETYLSGFSVGELVDYEGISDGIENTNYFVDTSQGRFVLTIFEHHMVEEMQYFLNLMHHLADHGVPSADPVADNQGRYLNSFKDKPIALVKRLNGHSIVETTVDHCRQLGDAMGRMHAAGLEFTEKQENPRGPHWFRTTATKVMPQLSTDDKAVLDAEIRYQHSQRDADIPRGVIHADLFRDNALWNTSGDQQTFSGIIDFYYSCDDALLYDLAISANDWCINDDYSLNRDKVIALLQAYAAHRPLQAAEQALWPAMLRAAALRFWLSRLHDLHFPRPGELVQVKDPAEFRAIILDRILNQQHYHDFWPS